MTMKYIRRLLLLSLVVLATAPGAFSTEIQVSGLINFVARDINQNDFSNETFRGFSNFHTSRTRIFFDASVDRSTSAFVQLLVDNANVSLYAAYVRFERLAGNYVNLHVGLIPTTVGSFSERTYSNVNPLIGTPLLYNFHSSFVPTSRNPILSIDSLFAGRSVRPRFGAPILYDACWNSGVDLFGYWGKLNYSIAALAGSLSKPTQQQLKNMPQITTRISYLFDPGFQFGVSAYYGPYLLESMIPDSVPTGSSLNDYVATGAGYDLYFARNLLEVHSEFFYNVWEYPVLPDLKATSGYFEAKYKFSPGWYAAGRLGWFIPGKVTLSDGTKERWDYLVTRYEAGVGYWFSRNVLGKVVAQINRFEDGGHLDSDVIAFQLSANLR